MKGLQVTEAGKVQFKTFTKQYQLKENEVKINVIYGGICGSDIAVYKGKLPHAQYPVVPGHEIIGEIIATGENATKAIGQRVVVQPNTHCGKCSFCKMG